MGYSLRCKLCKQRGIEKSYEGETARNLHLRGKEHARQLKNKDNESVMYKHVMEDHAEEENIFFISTVNNGEKKTRASLKLFIHHS